MVSDARWPLRKDLGGLLPPLPRTLTWSAPGSAGPRGAQSRPADSFPSVRWALPWARLCPGPGTAGHRKTGGGSLVHRQSVSERSLHTV